MTVPVIEAIKVEPNPVIPQGLIVTVKCPYCHKRHVHGIHDGSDTGGRRAPHCLDPTTGASAGYYIFIGGGMMPK